MCGSNLGAFGLAPQMCATSPFASFHAGSVSRSSQPVYAQTLDDAANKDLIAEIEIGVRSATVVKLTRQPRGATRSERAGVRDRQFRHDETALDVGIPYRRVKAAVVMSAGVASHGVSALSKPRTRACGPFVECPASPLPVQRDARYATWSTEARLLIHQHARALKACRVELVHLSSGKPYDYTLWVPDPGPGAREVGSRIGSALKELRVGRRLVLLRDLFDERITGPVVRAVLTLARQYIVETTGDPFASLTPPLSTVDTTAEFELPR